MSNQKTNLSAEEALELNKDLYRSDYRQYHNRAIVCLGLDRWLELAELARVKAVEPNRYFSYLINKEWSKFNQAKNNGLIEKGVHNG